MDIIKRIPTVIEYLRLRHDAGWWDMDEAATEKALSNSLFSVVAIADDNVIGVGRIIGDGGLYYYIQDLIVHSDYQNRGIGKKLMKEMMYYLNEHAAEGAFIGLIAAKGYSGFYEPFGFKARDKEAPGMFMVIKRA